MADFRFFSSFSSLSSLLLMFWFVTCTFLKIFSMSLLIWLDE